MQKPNRTMAGPILVKRKTMKPSKRLGRPQKNNRLDAERIYNLLQCLKKVVESQESPQSKCRLDFGDKSPQNSHVLPKPTFYTPKGKDALMTDLLKKFHSLADDVVSDDEDLLDDCKRLSVQFATMKINKPRTDYESMMLECPKTDEKFFAAWQRSAQKLAKPKRLIDSLDEAAKPIEVLKPESLDEFEIVSNSPLKKPEERLKIEIVPNPHEGKPKEKADKVFLANLEIVPKPPDNKTEKTESNPPAKIIFNDLNDNLQIIPKSTGNNPEKCSKVAESKLNPSTNLEMVPKAPENKPEKTSKIGAPKSNTSAKLEIVPKPCVKISDKIPKSKASANLETIPKLPENQFGKLFKVAVSKLHPSKPPEKKPEEKSDKITKSKPLSKPVISSKVVVPKSNPLPNISIIDLTVDRPKIVPKAAEKKTDKLKVNPKPAQKKPVKISSKKPNSDPSVKLEVAPKYSYEKTEKTFSKIALQDRNYTRSLKDFRFPGEKKKVGEYHRNTFKRFIVIDGSNVAFAHGNFRWFSSEGIMYCLQHFEKMGHPAKVVLPLYRRNAFQSSDPQIIDQLHREGKIVFTPCRTVSGVRSNSYDDRFILQLAYELNAAVISNDNFRDICNESLEFKEIVENRVVGYAWCDNIFMLPKDPYGQRGPFLDDILQC